MPAEDRPSYVAFVERFEDWKSRNLTNIDEPKHEGDDLHCPFTDQLHMLEQVGFHEVDLFLKYRLWSMIGGTKGRGDA